MVNLAHLMHGSAATAAFVALLSTAPVASAEPIAGAALQQACADRTGSDRAVFVCDPQGRGRRISLSLGADHVSVYRDDHGSVESDPKLGDGASSWLGGDEPLHPG